MSYPLFTKGGYSFYHATSAFQKFIRRGMEHEALYFGTELYLSNYEEYVWFRIRVMVSEDIGLAMPYLPAQIDALYNTYTEFKKKKNKHCPEKLPFCHAIMLLARSQKSRLVDNKLCYYFDLRDTQEKLTLPDFVFDMHTIEGRMKKRGNDHFYEESAKITNENTSICPDEYEFRDFVWNLYQRRDKGKKSIDSEDDPEQQEIKF